ncbi:hypothetical protein PC116_g25343 [Phytophthora cactorum]|nr:hypothetical protein PI126_g20553 [Phytophthora idaei]KAG4226244.1 hypothetical protein PC116_g25343 [Phytophthora cactorum]
MMEGSDAVANGFGWRLNGVDGLARGVAGAST